MFTEHTVESAPAAARRSMTATTSHLGYLPSAVALMATSPDLLDGFLKLSAMFEGTTLDPIAREVVIMTIATRNGCHICVALGVPSGAIDGRHTQSPDGVTTVRSVEGS